MKIGDRVQVHPITDAWMMGDKFGEITDIYSHFGFPEFVFVLMDRSNIVRKFRGNDILEVVQ